MAEKLAELNKGDLEGDLEVYSTNEKRIGVWINGKPLYRRVFQLTTPSTANTNTNIYTSLDTNIVVHSIRGIISYYSGSELVQFEANCYYSDDYTALWRRGSANIGMRVSNALKNQSIDVILEYTKNTD